MPLDKRDQLELSFANVLSHISGISPGLITKKFKDEAMRTISRKWESMWPKSAMRSMFEIACPFETIPQDVRHWVESFLAMCDLVEAMYGRRAAVNPTLPPEKGRVHVYKRPKVAEDGSEEAVTT
jgi:hypothetical protein